MDKENVGGIKMNKSIKKAWENFNDKKLLPTKPLEISEFFKNKKFIDLQSGKLCEYKE